MFMIPFPYISAFTISNSCLSFQENSVKKTSIKHKLSITYLEFKNLEFEIIGIVELQNYDYYYREIKHAEPKSTHSKTHCQRQKFLE